VLVNLIQPRLNVFFLLVSEYPHSFPKQILITTKSYDTNVLEVVMQYVVIAGDAVPKLSDIITLNKIHR